MSIWNSPSQYGTYSSDTKPVSTSTAHRWVKEDRSRTRRCKALAIQARKKESAVAVTVNKYGW